MNSRRKSLEVLECLVKAQLGQEDGFVEGLIQWIQDLWSHISSFTGQKLASFMDFGSTDPWLRSHVPSLEYDLEFTLDFVSLYRAHGIGRSNEFEFLIESRSAITS